jgi:hypothetical protein
MATDTDPTPGERPTDRHARETGGVPSRWRRSTHRRLHLLVAAALGTFVYSPLRTVPTAVLAVQFVVFPALVLSGLALWRGGRLRAWWRTRGRTGGRR